MKFSKADTRRIMDAFEDYLEGFQGFGSYVGDTRERHLRVFRALLTRKRPAAWRASRSRQRKLPAVK